MSTEDSNFPVVSKGEIGRAAIQTVNARELHAFMKVGKDFSTWIKDRIEQFGFIEELDFIKVEDLRSPISGSTKSRPQTVTEYILAIDMAKELAMVERNEQGKKARLHFIECERRLKAGQISSIHDLLANPHHLLAIAQGYAVQIEDLKRDVSSMKQDVNALDRIAKADDLYGLRQTVQILQQQERAFVRWVQSIAWCFRHSGSKTLMAYADKRKALLVTHKLEVFTKPDGSEGTREVLKFTTAGIVKLAKMLGIEPDFSVGSA